MKKMKNATSYDIECTLLWLADTHKKVKQRILINVKISDAKD
jgi:hypothetical protein